MDAFTKGARMSRWGHCCAARRRFAHTVQRFLLFGIVALPFAIGLAAQVPIAQMYHKSWTARDGAPNNITAIANGADGFLWVASDAGLYRFDGVSFERYTPPQGSALLSDQIFNLLAAQDGSLWMTYTFGGLSRIKDGLITNFTEQNGLRGGPLSSIKEDKDGGVWASGDAGLQVIRNLKVIKVGADSGLPGKRLGDITIDAEGNVWIPSDDDLMVLPYGKQLFKRAAKTGGNIWSCSKDRWIGIWCLRTDASIVHFTLTQPEVLPSDGHGIVLGDDLLETRDRTIWITTHQQGIERFSATAKVIPRAGSKEMEHYGSREGLSGDHPFSLLEDREGSVWVATTNGLDQFRSVPFTPVDLGGEATVSLPVGKPQPRMVLATDRLFELTAGHATPLTAFFNTWSRSLYEGTDGTLWIGTSAGLLKYVSGRPQPQKLPSLPPGSFHRVQAITEDDRGGLWIALTNSGLYRFDGTTWLKRGGYDALPEASSVCAYRDHEGRAWFGFLDGRVAQLSSGKVQVFSRSDGLTLGGIKVFAESNGHIWAGGDHGVAVLKSGSFHTLLLAGNQEIRGVTGVAFATNGDLWINGGSGILRIAKEQVALDDADPTHAVTIEAFNYLDGIRGIPDPLYGLSSAWMAPDGRLYFATRTNLQWIDPLQIPHNPVPPPVWITAIKADNKSSLWPATSLRFKPNVANLQVNYTAASLLIPERVRFRYKLAGYDKDWIDAGTRREAFYSKLPPGTYTFKVIACNDSGLWNSEGANIAFTIPPTFVQTIWFELLIGILFLLLTTYLFRLRLAQAKRRIRERIYERLAERERIARDLHDTFFQGIQGLLLRFNTAKSGLPGDHPTRQILEETLRQSDQVMLEGRELLLDLRTTERNDLPATLADYGNRMQKDHGCEFELVVSGTLRLLYPAVGEEISRVGKEALGNAFRHSGARSIEAELNYEPNQFRLRIRDDGAGIDRNILEQGRREGHWGLQGMRERAENIGAHLEIWSRPGAGTEIDLRLPADLAFTPEPHISRKPRFRAIMTAWVRSLASSLDRMFFR